MYVRPEENELREEGGKKKPACAGIKTVRTEASSHEQPMRSVLSVSLRRGCQGWLIELRNQFKSG